ncbi:MAG: hypothetical protein R2741_05010 [Methanolobus sp.]
MDFRSETTFEWLYSQEITTVKDLSRLVQASHLWNEENNCREKTCES